MFIRIHEPNSYTVSVNGGGQHFAGAVGHHEKVKHGLTLSSTDKARVSYSSHGLFYTRSVSV